LTLLQKQSGIVLDLDNKTTLIILSTGLLVQR